MGCRVAQLVDVVVDGRVLGYIGVRGRDVGFRLVVVVVGDKILHGIVRKELLELAAKLGGEGLVVRQHQCRALHTLDDLGHRVGLAGAGHAEQYLLAHAACKPPCQRLDGLRLVAGGRIFRYDMKFTHGLPLIPAASRRSVRRSAPARLRPRRERYSCNPPHRRGRPPCPTSSAPTYRRRPAGSGCPAR